MEQTYTHDTPLLRAVQRYLLADEVCGRIIAQDRITDLQDEWHTKCLIEAERALQEIAKYKIESPQDARVALAFAKHLLDAAEELPDRVFAVAVSKLCEGFTGVHG